MTNSQKVLVAGFPRAGKSSFADVVERSSLALIHVPMDRYILPIPSGSGFLEWVKEPSCVDWNLLLEHLSILDSGRVCFTPKPDWSDRGRRLCSGGALAHGLGRRMNPSGKGYIIAGTHVFSLGSAIGTHVKVFIDSPEIVIVSRLEGRLVSAEEKEQVVRRHLGDNLISLHELRNEADVIIDGTWPHESQVNVLGEYLAEK